MRKTLLLPVLLACCLLTVSVAVGQVGIGTTTPDPSAQLELQTTTRGFLPPRMTAVEMNAITSPAAGLVVYNTTANVLYYRDGGTNTWLPIAGAGGDNLGNHTATQNLDLSTFQLVGEGGTAGMYITAAGNVGIGTTTPGGRLNIVGDWNQALVVSNPNDAQSGAGIYLEGANRAWAITATNAGAPDGGEHLGFWDDVAAAHRMLIDQNGNVGIGTITPTRTLDVVGNGYVRYAAAFDIAFVGGNSPLAAPTAPIGRIGTAGYAGSNTGETKYGGAFQAYGTNGGLVGLLAEANGGGPGTNSVGIYTNAYGGADTTVGIIARSYGTGNLRGGLLGYATSTGGVGTTNFGVWGRAEGAALNVGVYGEADVATGYAGFFRGNLAMEDGVLMLPSGPGVDTVLTSLNAGSTNQTLPTGAAVWNAIAAAPGDGWGTDVATASGFITGDGTSGDPLRFINGTSVGHVPTWNGTNWTSAAVTGDNLGNHTATQILNLNGNWLSGDGGAEGVFVAADGNVGIGTATPVRPFTQEYTQTATTGNNIPTMRVTTTFAPGAASTANIASLDAVAATGTSNGTTAVLYGLNAVGRFTGAGTFGTIRGAQLLAENTGGGTVATLNGSTNLIQNTNNGQITSARASYHSINNFDAGSNMLNASASAIQFNNSGTITNARGLYFQAPINTGTITNMIGVDIDEIATGTNRFAIRYAHPTSPFAVLGSGNVGVGTATPVSQIEVAATGVAAQGTFTTAGAGVHSAVAVRRALGTTAVPTAITLGTNLGQVLFQGYDGTAYATGAEIRSNSTQAWSGAAHGTNLRFFTTLNNSTTPTERMTIAQDGNVGINIATPNAPLDIQHSGTLGYFRVFPGAGLDIDVDGGTNGTFIINNSSALAGSGFFFRTGGATPTLTVLNTGNIGIGIAAPNSELQFPSNLNNRKITLYEVANNDHEFSGFGINNGVVRYQAPSTTTNHVFYAATGPAASNEIFRVAGTGRVGIGGAVPNADLQFVNAVNPRKIVLFETANNDHQIFGFGITAGEMRYQLGGVGTANVWYAATGPAASNELMRLTGGGNLGIGTNSPLAKLHTIGTVHLEGLATTATLTGYQLAAVNTTTGAVERYTGGLPGDNLGNHTATTNLQLGANWLSGDGGSEGVFVDAAGNVGVQNATPAMPLDVTGNANITGAYHIGGTSMLRSPAATTVSVGNGAGNANNENTYMGYTAGQGMTGQANAVYGAYAGLLGAGNFNTYIGVSTNYQGGNGSGNTYLGYEAGYSNIDGDNNTLLGRRTELLAGGLTNATAIGHLAAVGTSNSIILGSINGTNGATANTNVGIGTTAPAARLHTVGAVRHVSLGISASLAGHNLAAINTTTGELVEFTGSLPGDNLGNHTATAQIQGLGGAPTQPAFSFAGDLNTGLNSVAADELSLMTAATNRLTINAVGEVGIGVAPAANIRVGASTASGAAGTVAVNGQATSLTPSVTYGVSGSSASSNLDAAGVAGFTASAGQGVLGRNSGTTDYVAGVWGDASTITTNITYGVFGSTASTDPESAGIHGYSSNAASGVYGISTNVGTAVWGWGSGTGHSIVGTATASGRAIQADAIGSRLNHYTAAQIYNTATSATASINKIGLDIQSTGAWTGVGATNTALNVNAAGGTTNYAAVLMGGNVGIGTTTPAAQLHTTGTVRFAGLATTATLTGYQLAAVNTTTGAVERFTGILPGDNLGNHTATQNLNLGTFQLVGNGGTSGIMIDAGGNVGLGTSAVSAKLYVNTNATNGIRSFYTGTGISSGIYGGTSSNDSFSAGVYGESTGGGSGLIGINGSNVAFSSALFARHTGASGTQYGIYTDVASTSGIAVRAYAAATSGTTVGLQGEVNNANANANATGVLGLAPTTGWAGRFNGRLGAGTTQQFQVDASGDLVRIDNVTYNWPSAQGAASTVLTNDGSGGLSWATPVGDNLGNHIATLQIQSTLGTAAAPGYSFTGDLNTGIYSPAADQLSISTAGTQRVVVDGAGNMGVGVASPLARFEVATNITNASGTNFGIRNEISYNNSAPSSATVRGTSSVLTMNGVASQASMQAYGAYNAVLKSTNQTLGEAAGAYNYVQMQAAGGTITAGYGSMNIAENLHTTNGMNIAVGSLSRAANANGGTILALMGSQAGVRVLNSSVVTNGYGLNIEDPQTNTGGTITNYASLMISEITATGIGTARAIRYDHATNPFVVMGNGNVGIGILSPAAQLHTTGTARFAGLATIGTFTDASDDFLIVNAAGDVQRYTGALPADNLGNHIATAQIQSTLGTVAAPGYSFNGNLNTGVYSPGADQLAFSTAGTARMTINGGGYVGIGTAPVASTMLRVIGSATDNYGIRADASANVAFPAAAGVVGNYTGTNSGSGVLGDNTSTIGRGVSGRSTAATGLNYGVWGQTASTAGVGTYGEATAATGVVYGVQGNIVSTTAGAAGVFGNASGGGVNGVFGVLGQSNANSGSTAGVKGVATGATADVTGVWGEVSSTGNFAAGVYGRNTAATGQNYGIYGRMTANTTNFSAAVRGLHEGATGITYGMQGVANSTTALSAGVAGLQTGNGRVYGVYGEISTSTTDSAAGVRGDAWTGTGLRFGVIGKSTSTTAQSAGVYGESNQTGATNTMGVWGHTRSTGAGSAGVYGTSANTGYGVWGVHTGATAGSAAVRGNHNASTANITYGVSGVTTSTNASAAGVHGLSSTAANGVLGINSSVAGTAIWANHTGTGAGYGLYGQSSGTGGTGVYGYSSATTGANAGVWGDAASTVDFTCGTYGRATATTGRVFGIYGRSESNGTNAAGVYGLANGATGQVSGVEGRTASSNAFAAGVLGISQTAANGVYALSMTGSTGLALRAVSSDVRTVATTTALIDNQATSTTAAIAKTGLSIQSTGGWTGAGATNTGLVVNVSGGTINTAATFTGGNVGIGTTTPSQLLNVQGGNMLLSSVAVAPGELRLEEGTNTAGDHYTAFRAGDQAANITYTLPVAQGGAGTVLTNNGAGTLSWAAPGAGSYIDNQNAVDQVANFRINGSGRFGGSISVGTTAAPFVGGISMPGDIGTMTMQMNRNTGVGIGQVLHIEAGAAAAGATNASGGVLELSGGISTGSATGLSSSIQFRTATGGAPGTLDNAPTVKMVLNSAGNLGIGTTAPNTMVHLYQASGQPQLTIETDDNSPDLILDGWAATSGVNNTSTIEYREAGAFAASNGWDAFNNMWFVYDAISGPGYATLTVKGSNVGVNLGAATPPAVNMDINGSLALRANTLIYTNGNYVGLSPGTFSTLVFNNNAAAATIRGITGGVDGRMLIIMNTTSTTVGDMVITNQDAGAAATDRIVTGNGGNLTSNAALGFCVVLVYNGTAQRWQVVSSNL